MGMSASSVGGQDVAYTSDLAGTFYSYLRRLSRRRRAGKSAHRQERRRFVAGFDATWLAPVMSDGDGPHKPMPRSRKSRGASARPAIRLRLRHARAGLVVRRQTQGRLRRRQRQGGGPRRRRRTTRSRRRRRRDDQHRQLRPDVGAVRSSTSDVMTSKDEFFATATELPQEARRDRSHHVRLRGAGRDRRDRVRADLPAVVGGSGKLRHIRVPQRHERQVRQGDADVRHPAQHPLLQDVPPQGRRRTGALTYRKMETRVIVARAGRHRPADGVATRQNALFGTYVWSEDETHGDAGDAALTAIGPRLRRHRPQRTSPTSSPTRTSSTAPPAASTGRWRRRSTTTRTTPAYRDLLQHYAIPGSLRCVQCHMGSPTQGLRARLHSAAGQRRADRHRRHVRADRRRRADPAAALDRLRRHHRHDLADRRDAAGGIAGRAQAAQDASAASER